MKRSTKIMALVLCGILLLIALDARLAQPERKAEHQDRFVGFHLVYQAGPDYKEVEDWGGTGERVYVWEHGLDYSNWTVYGEDSMYIQGLGQVKMEKRILIGQENEQGQFIFPGLEGQNCFLAFFPDENGEGHYGGYAGAAEVEVSLGENAESLHGTVYFGPPQDAGSRDGSDLSYVWTLYPVYQMEDGTVYLTDSTEGSYGGAGGFTITRSEEQTVNGDVKISREISVSMTVIPRLERLTLRQFDGNDEPLRADELTQEEAEALREGRLELPLEAETAYVIAAVSNDGGSTEREVLQPDENGEIALTRWFLDREGMGYPVTIKLEKEG